MQNEKKAYYSFSEIEAKELEWLWKPYIIKGNLNIIVGEGGVGKSYLTTWLLSSISKGNKIPFSDDNFITGNSILQNAEDDPNATILPRLLSNNADTNKIIFINEEDKILSIQQIERLEAIIIETHPEIIILDPIQAYIGNINMNSANEVRNALKPLKNLAERYNCAIVMLMHLNKNNGTNKATSRVMGSTDFLSTCRSAILVVVNPENEEEKLFIPIKTNLMKENEKNSLSFKINDLGQIEWLENKGKICADDILDQNNNFLDKNSYAKGFILGALSRGVIKGTDLEKLALDNNITLKNYNVSKALLNKENVIYKFQSEKTYYWGIKSTDDILE